MLELVSFIVMIFLVVFAIFLLIYTFFQKDEIKLKARENDNPSIAIIIPARDESKVIEGLLKSVMNQSYKVDANDVYIVVESKDDKTCDIAKKYGMNIVLRRDLSLARKSYAIDDAIKYINEQKRLYALYFIFDADNILDKDFIFYMIDSYKKGYDITIGYRNTKNGNDSVVVTSSSLTFTMINTIFNKNKVKRGLNVTVSGTGFYISGDIINKLGGYPFNTLTEDYELSVYSALAGLNSTYNENAIFYDEQPIKYKTTKVQRIRWIRGYIDTRKKYIQEIKNMRRKTLKRGSIEIEYIGVKPYLIIVIGIALYILANIIMLILNLFSNGSYLLNLFNIIILLFIVYVILAFITLIMIKSEKEYFGLSNRMKFKAVLYNPIFLISYVPCAIKAFLNPNVGWKKIEHNKNV